MNKRLGMTVVKALGLGCGVYLLDCYNRIVQKRVSCTITTRVDASAATYLFEVYE